MTRRLLMTADAVGGVWTYAVELARALEPQGWDTMIALLGPAPETMPGDVEVIETDAALDWLAADEGAVANAALQVANLARERGADVVQLNSPALTALADWSAPVVAVAHGDAATWWDAVGTGPFPEDLRWIAELNRRGLATADRVVAPSAAFAADVARVHGLARTPEVVLNGRSPPELSPAAAPARSVLTAGRLWDKAKDLATYNRLAARLAVPAEAAGPVQGPQGERIALEHARALGRLHPNELGRRLAERPVFVSTARFEPFGLAVLEAAQAGCALVLSDIPTFRELWDGIARFAPPGDDAGFAREAEALLGDDHAREKAGRRARDRADLYTPERTATAMAALFERLVGSRQERAAA